MVCMLPSLGQCHNVGGSSSNSCKFLQPLQKLPWLPVQATICIEQYARQSGCRPGPAYLLAGQGCRLQAPAAPGGSPSSHLPCPSTLCSCWGKVACHAGGLSTPGAGWRLPASRGRHPLLPALPSSQKGAAHPVSLDPLLCLWAVPCKTHRVLQRTARARSVTPAALTLSHNALSQAPPNRQLLLLIRSSGLPRLSCQPCPNLPLPSGPPPIPRRPLPLPTSSPSQLASPTLDYNRIRSAAALAAAAAVAVTAVTIGTRGLAGGCAVAVTVGLAAAAAAVAAAVAAAACRCV